MLLLQRLGQTISFARSAIAAQTTHICGDGDDVFGDAMRWWCIMRRSKIWLSPGCKLDSEVQLQQICLHHLWKQKTLVTVCVSHKRGGQRNPPYLQPQAELTCVAHSFKHHAGMFLRLRCSNHFSPIELWCKHSNERIHVWTIGLIHACINEPMNELINQWVNQWRWIKRLSRWIKLWISRYFNE